MEKYQGVKFQHRCAKSDFRYDHRLTRLNHWAHLFSELGLAPVHATGAYGNSSYRTGDTSFIITKSAMQPTITLQEKNFCEVVGFEEQTTTFVYMGAAPPSSESFLHHALYQKLPHVGAILHGHCSLLNIHANALRIPMTKQFCEYGTQELAESALCLVDQSTLFFILKDHGFVALGADIDSAGQLTLDYYSQLITLIKRI